MPILHRFVERLERAEGLDRVADKLAEFGRPLSARPGLSDALTGRWLGHSVHPMVVAVPIGCWTSAAILDVTSPGSAAARRLVGAGVLGAVPAALTGTADWLDTAGAERRVGTAHALANDIAVGAFAMSWLARRRGSNWIGAGLTGIGLGAMGVAGYLGGHLAYARGVGINTTAFQSGPDDWTAIADTDDLEPGRATQVDLDGLALLVVKRGGLVHVLEDRCTHRGAPLSDGDVVNGCIECPWHGSRFELTDGSVRSGPASIPQPAYETRIVDGRVEIRRAEPGGLRTAPVGAAHGQAS
ncbi:MAG TPA: Rieske 2Fe-2S domain-containing protein [Ilumatobacteraceae bacterium]|nr:Rieske 2Fe-2S domain-containing protein [Ilumatobacteraceae bacterium]